MFAACRCVKVEPSNSVSEWVQDKLSVGEVECFEMSKKWKKRFGDVRNRVFGDWT
jgi:hypothetical protein